MFWLFAYFRYNSIEIQLISGFLLDFLRLLPDISSQTVQ